MINVKQTTNLSAIVLNSVNEMIWGTFLLLKKLLDIEQKLRNEGKK